MAGTAVFKIVVSRDSMKKATAISHGSNRRVDSGSGGEDAAVPVEKDKLSI
jgi:hypothetical protein